MLLCCGGLTDSGILPAQTHLVRIRRISAPEAVFQDRVWHGYKGVKRQLVGFCEVYILVGCFLIDVDKERCLAVGYSLLMKQ